MKNKEKSLPSRRSLRRSANDGTKNGDTIIIIKSGDNGEPAEQIADVKSSLIEHMCNKCNKKYASSVGLKRHLKFCMPTGNGSPRPESLLTENHNDLASKNMNLVTEKTPSPIAVQGTSTPEENDNPYEFTDEENETAWGERMSSKLDDSQNGNPYEFTEEGSITEEELTMDIKGDSNICECCGENAETAHKAGDYRCEPCGKYFKKKVSFIRHGNDYHSTLPTAVPCDRCVVMCANETILLKHREVHNKKFFCDHCKKSFTRRYHLERHFQQTGCNGKKKNTYPCQVCDNVFTRKDNLRDHLRNHLGYNIAKKVYKCELCEKEFKGKTIMTIHMRTHTGETPFKCNHQKCGKAFTSKGALVKHERCHTGEKPFSCSQCSKTFAAKETLNRHLKTHSDEKPHVCLICGKSFIQTIQLKSHMFYHTGDGFKCKYCNQTFGRKNQLQLHEKFGHEGAEKISCKHKGCDKSFVRKDDYKKHLLIHTNEKPFKCDNCGKCFRTRSLVTVHMRTHRQETTRFCPQCPRAFIRGDCLLRHMKAKHPDEFKIVLREARKNKLDEMKRKLNNYKNMQGAGGAKKSAVKTLENGFENRIPITTGEQLLQLASSAGDIEVEVVDIPLSEEYLANSIQDLLALLIDQESFDAFNWTDLPVDTVLEGVIEKCGYTPVRSEVPDRGQRLRENAKRLLTVVIEESSVKELVETQTVDEVILHVLRMGRAN